MTDAATMQKQAEDFRQRYNAVQEQISRVIVGHEEIIQGVLTAIFVGTLPTRRRSRPWQDDVDSNPF